MKAVNLLPSEQRGSAKTAAIATAKPDQGGTPFGAYVVLGILAFAVAATALLVLAGNTVKDRKSELAQVTAEAQATQAKAAALQSYADFEGVATQRISTVRGLAGVRFDWERTLGDLARALPANVHLRSVDGSTAGGSGGVTAGTQAPTIQLTGCTSSQMSVATLMSRLRNVRGVTRVTLARSQKAETTAAAPAAASDDGAPAELCPKGSPPEFDVTMYFERAAVPAAAAVNTGAATTAPAAGAPGAAAPAASPAPGTAPAPAATAAPGATASTTTTSGATP